MRLTWRDGLVSGLVGTAAALYALWATGVAMTTVSAKAIGVAVFGLGWAACVTNRREMAIVYGVDQRTPRPTTGYAVAASILGAAALIAGIATLFTGSEPLLLVLLGALVALWVIATARHAFGWWTESLGDRARPIDRAA